MPDTTLSNPTKLSCPQCQKPTQWADNPYRPFCSERCKLIDLGAWASETYRVPADDSPFSDEFEQ